MAKRGRIEIIRDILKIIQENHNSIKVTPLLRKSNLSSQRFYEYFQELLKKKLIKTLYDNSGKKKISLTENGQRYLEKYLVIVGFIDEFGL